MRLLEILPNGDFRPTKNLLNDAITQYAILSHTWGDDSQEVTFEDMVNGSGRHKAGYEKIRFCGEQAARDGLQYFWVDSCCIKKSSDSELSESINSIFRWYQRAATCYVYVSDVSTRKRKERDEELENTWESAFRNSRWFMRGWTLQELLAPASVKFFSREGSLFGDKQSLKQQIHEVTAIPITGLLGRPLSEFGVEERMSWAEMRLTKREEDFAYCLLGLFDIHIPIIYGEGRANAVRRLRREIEELTKYTHERGEKERKPNLNHIHSLNHLDPRGQRSTKDSLATTYPEVCSLPLPDFQFRVLTLDPGDFAT
jgi:Heterokaryon incompatibility protein (HET)